MVEQSAEATRARRVAASGLLAGAGRAYRSLGQVLLLVVFGALGLVFTALFAPLLRFYPAPSRRRAAARALVSGLLRGYTGAMHLLRLIELDAPGLSKLAAARGVLFVANHPTLVDAFFLLGRIPGLVPVAKRPLLANPFTCGALVAADYLANDSGPLLLDACRQRLLAGESLLLFPEGGRTPAAGEPRFRRGAAQLAVRAGCPVIPVTIEVSERFLTREDRWWLAPAIRPRVSIRVHAAIDPAPFVAACASPALAARRLNEHLQEFYAKELSRCGSA